LMLILLFLIVLGIVPYFIIRYLANQKYPSSSLIGKSILITGCDTGFGNLAAIKIASRGDLKVFAGCLTDKGVQDLSSKANIHPFRLDITKQASIDEAYEMIKSELGQDNGLWGVINNAGILRGALLEVTPLSDFRLMFDVNVIGLSMVCKKFIPLLRKLKDSRIVNIASVAGRLPVAGLSAYCGSKFAVEGISDSLRRELIPWGVRVVIIEPGAMKTPLYDVSFSETVDKIWNDIPEDTKQAYGREFFDTAHQNSKKLVDILGDNPQKVVDAMELAVISTHPPHRMSIGKDAPIWILVSYLPTWFSDRFLRLLEWGHPIPLQLQRK